MVIFIDTEKEFYKIQYSFMEFYKIQYSFMV